MDQGSEVETVIAAIGDPSMVQVVMHAMMLPWLARGLDAHGLHLYEMPVEGDLPTYGVGIGLDELTAQNGIRLVKEG